MFSQRNNPYCDLLQICMANIAKILYSRIKKWIILIIFGVIMNLSIGLDFAIFRIISSCFEQNLNRF